MIDLHFAPTPNGWKAAIMLRELGLEHRVVPVDLSRGEQRTPEYLAISPGGKIPAIVDHDVDGDPVSVFESGAILWHLAEKTGRLISASPDERRETLQWLFWQTGFQGPMAGQHSHFSNFAPEAERAGYAAERFRGQYAESVEVMERRFEARDWIVGSAYSIADIQCFPWAFFAGSLGVPLDGFPRVADWRARIEERPAVQEVMRLGP